jgi:type IV pilus assembly protein PilO
MADIPIDKIIKLPNQQKFLILGAVIAAVVGSYIYFIEMPARETLKAKQQNLTKLQAKHNEQKKVLANLPRFKKELAYLQIKFEESLKQLPNTREIPSLLTNISNLARDCGLEIFLFQLKPEVSKGFYADIPVDMKVTGKYHNLGYFFDRLSKLNRIVNISDILMSSTKAKDAEPGSLEASFKAVTFKFIEKATDIGKKKGRKRKKG